MNKLIIIFFICFTFSFSNADNENLNMFNQAYNIFQSNYVDSLNNTDIIIEGINGMLDSVDPYTKLLVKASKDNYDGLRKGKYGGIGIQMGNIRDSLAVFSVFEESPSEAAGLKFGDFIIQVDSVKTNGLSVSECSQLIKGDLGTSVSLKVYRPSINKILPIEIIRNNIPLKKVPYHILDQDGIGYIKLTKFAKNADTDFRDKLMFIQYDCLSEDGLDNETTNKNGEKINLTNKKRCESLGYTWQKNDLNGLIIDLRGNSGGLLKVAIKILENFTPQDELLFSQKGKTSRSNKQYFSKRTALIDEDVPIVILVNKSSASASEIVSGALQDLDRAVIVGQKTFGKGLVQNIFDFKNLEGDKNDTISIKVTTAKYYLPSGRLIQKQDYTEDGFLTDGLDKKDSIFYTANGREVKGGGGVTPDIILESENKSNFIRALFQQRVFLDFAMRELAVDTSYRLPVELNQKIINDFNNFLDITNFDFRMKIEDEYDELKKILSKQEISINPNSKNISYSYSNSKLIEDFENYINQLKIIQQFLPDNKEEIEYGLLKEFSKALGGEKERVKSSLVNDKEYIYAKNLLLNSEHYYEILLSDK